MQINRGEALGSLGLFSAPDSLSLLRFFFYGKRGFGENPWPHQEPRRELSRVTASQVMVEIPSPDLLMTDVMYTRFMRALRGEETGSVNLLFLGREGKKKVKGYGVYSGCF
ncbi:hypothetical protein TNIN_156411 [Trichonephila inaurata madagascariensis]|uniref:Uncharacterized protein n=1 Tax=Trichonephila inaurata madagascariensis TaxID=2747483 RepID=A0A8X6YKB5_9ARAC|nr:hypothetical protein TNIN_156411 [Trichonephila inaurata madagascariensis]